MLDGGDGLFAVPTLDGRPDAEPLRERARLIARSAVHAGLEAANVGRLDLAAGLAFVEDLAADPEVPWVSANLRRSDGSFPFLRWRLLRGAGLRILVTGVTPPEPRQDAQLGLVPLEPESALREVLTLAAADGPPADLVILLSTLGLPAERRLAQAVPGVHFIIGGGDRQVLADPVVEGNTAIFHAADRGRFVGLIQLDPAVLPTWRAPRTPRMGQVLAEQQAGLAAVLERTTGVVERRVIEAQQREVSLRMETAGSEFAHRLVPLSTSVGEDPTVAGWVTQVKQAAARQRRPPAPPPASQGVLPPISGLPPQAASAADHAGTGTCRPCHSAAYQAWSTTPHARSYAALRGQPRAPECLECHALRVPRAGGVSLEPIVGCEACHGPGALHPGPGNIVRAPTEATCRTCHRGYHPGTSFTFAKAYEKVRCDR